MPGSFTSRGLQDTIRTNGTPAVTRAGKQTTLSSTMTSGRVRLDDLSQLRLAVLCAADKLLPDRPHPRVQLLDRRLAELGRGVADEILPELPGTLASTGPASGGARSTRSSSKPSGSSRPFQDASAANTTRWPRRRNTSPIPMQLFVGPYALSGMNKIVSGRSLITGSLHGARIGSQIQPGHPSRRPTVTTSRPE